MTTILEKGLQSARAVYAGASIASDHKSRSQTKLEIQELKTRIQVLKTIQKRSGVSKKDIIEKLQAQLKEKKASSLSTCLSTASTALGYIPGAFTQALAGALDAGYFAAKTVESLEKARSEATPSRLTQVAVAINTAALVTQVGLLASQTVGNDEAEEVLYKANITVLATNGALSAYSFAKHYFG